MLTYLIKRGFRSPVYGNSKDFLEISQNVLLTRDITYTSDYPLATFDLAQPKVANDSAQPKAANDSAQPKVPNDLAQPKAANDSAQPKAANDSAQPKAANDLVQPKAAKGKTPVIFWAHGGGYVSGDKKDLTDYAVMLAGKGYAVVNFNYGLAPKTKYPKQLHQIADVFNYVKEKADTLGLDMDRIFFAGDSAGAHMISQFINIQTNSEYAQDIGIKQVVPKQSIRGVLLFCGFYDFIWYIDNRTGAKRFVFNHIAKKYFGKRKWRNMQSVSYTVIKNYLSKDFPPCFLTDGNTSSFEDQARDLEKALLEKGVRVQSVFHSADNIVGHEYQFHMNTPKAVEIFEQLILFLDSVLDSKESKNDKESKNNKDSRNSEDSNGGGL